MFINQYGPKTWNLVGCEIVGKRNFAGNEIQYNGRTVNGAGRRNFLVKISQEQYEQLNSLDTPWDVGQFAPNQMDPGAVPDSFMRLNISYYKEAPVVHYISNGIDTLLDEAHLDVLDRVNIVDLDIRVSEVRKQNRMGVWKVKPFVNEMWVTVTPDVFAEKYGSLKAASAGESVPVVTTVGGEDTDDLPF